MKQLIVTIIFIALFIPVIAIGVLRTGAETSYLTLSNYLYMEVKQVSFYLKTIKELREYKEDKLTSNVVQLLNQDREGQYIITGKRIETEKHFVDYSTQKITKEDKKITYNVLVDDYLCNYLIEKTEEKDDVCSKKENGSIYTYVLYSESTVNKN